MIDVIHHKHYTIHEKACIVYSKLYKDYNNNNIHCDSEATDKYSLMISVYYLLIKAAKIVSSEWCS